jgi:hypothetical protein
MCATYSDCRRDVRLLRVSGLRVADTSAHPQIANTAPSPMAHMSGFLGAELALEDERAAMPKDEV